MITREDLLSIEFLKKTEYTGCHQGLRYRIEKTEQEEGKGLKVTVWPEPYSFAATPSEEKSSKVFSFDDDGLDDAVAWMNDMLFKLKVKA